MKFSALVYRLCLLVVIAITLESCATTDYSGNTPGANVPPDRRTAGTIVEDQTIETKAWKTFLSDKEINDNAHINVTSYNTIVLVTGEAPKEALKKRIIKIVRGIEKVSRVYDEITIAAPSSYVSRSSDSVITSKVKTNLLAMKDFDGTRVKVVTEKGVAYLMGLLSHADSETVTDVVRKVGGVQKVVKLFQYID